eukprot:m.143246 g.143246  ORF g.143246 m.143246 type:complete len:190 (+) comp17162_c0_seq1:382-951(+)
MSVLEVYAAAFGHCRAWAEAGASSPFEMLAPAFATPIVPPFDAESIAILLSSQTDLASANKVEDFRATLTQHFQQISSMAFEADCEPWYRKDMTQLLCECLLFFDVTYRQQELIAILIQSVIDFGRDAMATIAFLLCCRAFWRHGRADTAFAETDWLVGAAARAIQRANEYLMSEFVGQVSLLELVQGM